MHAAPSLQALRKSAETQLASMKEAPLPPPGMDQLKLLHELQVHQIELEMQNEVLSDALTQADILRSKYQDLFDHAPVGYFTLSVSMEILQLNQCAARLLGQPQDKLAGRHLREFFEASSLSDLDDFLAAITSGREEVFSHGLIIRRKLHLPLHVNVQARAYDDQVSGKPQIRLTMMDVSELKMAKDDVVQAIMKATPHLD